MASVNRSPEGPSETTERILSALDEEQKSAVVEDIGDEVVSSIRGNGSEGFAKRVGRAVIDEIPLLGSTFLMRAGATRAVDIWLEENSEAVVEAVGDAVIDEIVESHASETVDASIDAVVERVVRTNKT